MIFSLLVKEQERLPPLYSCSLVPEPVSGVDNRASGSCCVVSEQKLDSLSLMLQVNVRTTRVLGSIRSVFLVGIGLF